MRVKMSTMKQQSDALRRQEYCLFNDITDELKRLQRLGEKIFSSPDTENLSSVLERNNNLWQVLALDCAHEDNQLSETARAGMISLSLWVNAQTLKADTRCPREMAAILDDMIAVNDTIKAGLRHKDREIKVSFV